MSNPVFVDILQEVDDLGDEEDFDVLVEFFNVCFDEIDELASLAVLKYKVQTLLVLE